MSRLVPRREGQECICKGCGAKEPLMVMLKDGLWLSIAEKRDILCLNCIEARLGRLVKGEDLKDCSVTHEMLLGYKIFSR